MGPRRDPVRGETVSRTGDDTAAVAFDRRAEVVDDENARRGWTAVDEEAALTVDPARVRGVPVVSRQPHLDRPPEAPVPRLEHPAVVGGAAGKLEVVGRAEPAAVEPVGRVAGP